METNTHELEHALKMLEQIAANYTWDEDQARAAAAVASHIKRFWTAEMRRQVAAAAQRGVTLSPLAAMAVQQI